MKKSDFLATRMADGKERGASLVEYALLLALIATVALPAVMRLGVSVEERYADPDLKDALLGAASFDP